MELECLFAKEGTLYLDKNEYNVYSIILFGLLVGFEHGSNKMNSKVKRHTGADPENFSRGGPTLTYNCGSAQI